MKLNVLLVGVNSKFIHSSLAVWYLKHNCAMSEDINILEFSINDDIFSCIRRIYLKKPDIIGFSCYIWNIEFIKKIISSIKKLLPSTKIILGGPEVSFISKENAKEDICDLVLRGEGEETFATAIQQFADQNKFNITDEYTLISDLNTIISPYSDEMFEAIGEKILYYESSRGCPYSCSYCMSSTFKGVRYFELERVFEELRLFAKKEIKLVKFVDRTFNCDVERSYKIFEYIIRNGHDIFKNMRFHFEVGADLFNKNIIELLKSARDGIFQFEAGVQTTNSEILQQINRKTDITRLFSNIEKIRETGNIHLHLDLIAGLPNEDYRSFVKSFNEVYTTKPHMIQLGFLKILKGTKIFENTNEFGAIYNDFPPFEVIRTKDISYEELLTLKKIEVLVDRFYNSGKFIRTIWYLESFFSIPFDLYLSLSNSLENAGFFEKATSMRDCYELILQFAKEKLLNINLDYLLELLKFDFLSSDNTCNLPQSIRTHYEKALSTKYLLILKDPIKFEKYFGDGCDKNSEDDSKRDSTDAPKNIFKTTRIEKFEYSILDRMKTIKKETYLIFNYNKKDPVSNLYKTILVENKEFDEITES